VKSDVLPNWVGKNPVSDVAKVRRALGLDIGSKTIGVALTDEANIAAHPLTVLARVGNVGDAKAVLALVTEHGVEDVIYGMPYELSGRIGFRGRRVQLLVDAIRKALPDTITLHEHDERFSTAEAERVLLEADISRAKRSAVIDQQAAALILQGWLDARKTRG
jgi:putative Holliday junction resolvase